MVPLVKASEIQRRLARGDSVRVTELSDPGCRPLELRFGTPSSALHLSQLPKDGRRVLSLRLEHGQLVSDELEAAYFTPLSILPSGLLSDIEKQQPNTSTSAAADLTVSPQQRVDLFSPSGSDSEFSMATGDGGGRRGANGQDTTLHARASSTGDEADRTAASPAAPRWRPPRVTTRLTVHPVKPSVLASLLLGGGPRVRHDCV